jgi:hypothetical protein
METWDLKRGPGSRVPRRSTIRGHSKDQHLSERSSHTDQGANRHKFGAIRESLGLVKTSL